jgi:N-methylhydantoinase B/oxoprolinase/acetone carboxylase alpha subunit
MVGQNEGVLDDGTSWGGGSVDFAGALPTGAFSMRDGLPLGWVFWNPQSDFGNLEEWDLINPPMMHLSRTLGEETVGHGRFRGGFPSNSLCLTVKPGRFNLAGFSSAGSANTTCGVCGVMGGYPGTGNWDMPIKNTNIKQLINEGIHYPRTYIETVESLKEGSLKAETAKLRKADSLMDQLHDGDLWLRGSSSGGGYGDPIERDPKLAADDANGGWIKVENIKNIYGVCLIRGKEGTWVVDERATGEERRLIRQKRKTRSVPVKDWWIKERERLIQKRIPDIVLNLHKDAMDFDGYRKKFTDFWQLSKDFKF